MKAIGIREIKNSLSKWLHLVEQGETVLVTDRGRVVAQIAPPPVYAGQPHASEAEALERLARAGRVRAAQPGVAVGQAALPPPASPVDLAVELGRARADRR